MACISSVGATVAVGKRLRAAPVAVVGLQAGRRIRRSVRHRGERPALRDNRQLRCIFSHRDAVSVSMNGETFGNLIEIVAIDR